MTTHSHWLMTFLKWRRRAKDKETAGLYPTWAEMVFIKQERARCLGIIFDLRRDLLRGEQHRPNVDAVAWRDMRAEPVGAAEALAQAAIEIQVKD